MRIKSALPSPRAEFGRGTEGWRRSRGKGEEASWVWDTNICLICRSLLLQILSPLLCLTGTGLFCQRMVFNTGSDDYLFSNTYVLPSPESRGRRTAMRAGECFTLAAVTALICETAWNKTPVIFHGKTSGHNFCVSQREQQRAEMPGHTIVWVPKSRMDVKLSVFNPGKYHYNHPWLSRFCLFIVFQYLQLCSSIFHIIPWLFPRVLSLCWFDVLFSGDFFNKFLLFPLRNLFLSFPVRVGTVIQWRKSRKLGSGNSFNLMPWKNPSGSLSAKEGQRQSELQLCQWILNPVFNIDLQLHKHHPDSADSSPDISVMTQGTKMTSHCQLCSQSAWEQRCKELLFN